jgi:hypothetical protein
MVQNSVKAKSWEKTKKREKDNRPCPYKKTTLKPYLEVSERLLHPRPLPRAATAGFRKFSSGRRQSGLPN